MELDGVFERNEGQGFADKFGEDKLVMRANRKTSYPLGCIFSYRKRSESPTEPFVQHRIPHTYPKLGRNSLATWGFSCFSILFSFLALTRALFKRRLNKRPKARCYIVKDQC